MSPAVSQMRQGHTNTAVIRWLSMRWRDTRVGVRLCVAMCLPSLSGCCRRTRTQGMCQGPDLCILNASEIITRHIRNRLGGAVFFFPRGRAVKPADTGSLVVSNQVPQNRNALHPSALHPSQYCVPQCPSCPKSVLRINSTPPTGKV